MAVKRYLASLPERLVRSVVGLGAGVVREVGDVAIPLGVRRTRLYQNLVDTTLRFLIEHVGGIEGTYRDEQGLADDFLARRTAGNVIEALGIVAFRASPVWVLAALADVCGFGRRLIPEVTQALAAEGLLEPGAEFESVDQLLDGLERASGRLAETFNTPPLDVATLRQEWQALRTEAARLGPERLPSRESLTTLWTSLRDEARRQDTSVYQTSSLMAVSAVRAVPERARWLAASATVAGARTGQVVAASLLEHYRVTLEAVGQEGYASYGRRQLRPYLRGAAAQFRADRQTFTERVLARTTRKSS
jgi:hypothetical protein